MTFCINTYKSLRYDNAGEVMFCCKSANIICQEHYTVKPQLLLEMT